MRRRNYRLKKQSRQQPLLSLIQMRKKQLKKKKTRARKLKRTRRILRRKKVSLRMTKKRKNEILKENMWSRLKVRFIKQTT